jgi:hypothetical protein
MFSDEPDCLTPLWFGYQCDVDEAGEQGGSQDTQQHFL